MEQEKNTDDDASANALIKTDCPKVLDASKPTMCYVQPPPGFELPIYRNTARLYKSYNRYKNVLCANCGGMGHVYKKCNHPIISYGIICFKVCADPDTNARYPMYLMIQRKDSLSYVEFIRGKYNLKNKNYILEMFSLMTNDERNAIRQKPFEVLWQEMWCKNILDDNKSYSKEYKEALDKFTILTKGYIIKNHMGDFAKNMHFGIDFILDNTTSKYDETEWGFPKGRRNINEGDVSCALREFKEETGIAPHSIHICSSYLKPFEEVFSGSNKIRYKHVYYAAKLVDQKYHDLNIQVDPDNKQQCKEIRNIRWFTYDEAQRKIRESNIERKELLRRLHTIICKQIVK